MRSVLLIAPAPTTPLISWLGNDVDINYFLHESDRVIAKRPLKLADNLNETAVACNGTRLSEGGWILAENQVARSVNFLPASEPNCKLGLVAQRATGLAAAAACNHLGVEQSIGLEAMPHDRSNSDPSPIGDALWALRGDKIGESDIAHLDRWP